MRIIGLDPGLRRTGWGIIDTDGLRLSYVASGVIAPSDRLPFSDRLLCLFEETSKFVTRYVPQEAAIEETFVSTNASSTLKLGHARAAAMIAPAKLGLPVYEYAARMVKKAIVGTGAADKSQIVFMIRRLLPLAGVTQTDEADALAVAITHAHSRSAAVRR
ncbi:crossover junction endodeoxyribonuclease RuvC [Phenylobacterium sp.]|uniref:crossover junction endodeoxyribonuclease RuvC n=1 Tax=Phenylobacterium sp. TaxID=1871053 RepID=UPI002FC60B86